MARKKDIDPRPVRTVARRVVVERIDIDSRPVGELSAWLLKLLREKGLSEDEINGAHLNLFLIEGNGYDEGYDGADVNITANVIEPEDSYNQRIADWKRRENERQKVLEAARRRDEAEFERLRAKLGKP